MNAVERAFVRGPSDRVVAAAAAAAAGVNLVAAVDDQGMSCGVGVGTGRVALVDSRGNW